MRKHEEMRKHAEACQEEKDIVQRTWQTLFEEVQDECIRIQAKCAALEQENKKLLGIIATLRIPPKRKPLPPKKVNAIIIALRVGMHRLRGREVVRRVSANRAFSGT